jgi:hypothetical protein
MGLLDFGLGIAEVVLRLLGNQITAATVVLVALRLIFGSQSRYSRCGSTWSRTKTSAAAAAGTPTARTPPVAPR